MSIQQAWSEISLLKLFEIAVLNKNTGENEYVIFDIELIKNKFIASHEPTTKKEAKSKKIATVQIKIDHDFSIDENLQRLFDGCQTKIQDSQFFELI
jgi:hypothetical protein